MLLECQRSPYLRCVRRGPHVGDGDVRGGQRALRPLLAGRGGEETSHLLTDAKAIAEGGKMSRGHRGKEVGEVWEENGTKHREHKHVVIQASRPILLTSYTFHILLRSSGMKP